MTQLAQTLILLLAFAGLIDALYFTLAYYGRIQKARWVPKILCAPEKSSCVTVVKTPYARVFGVPNSLLGIAYYGLLIWWAELSGPVGVEMAFGGEYHIFRLQWLLLLISMGTVALGFYLIYALRRKLGVNCPLCYTAHAINFALTILLIAIIK
jgi:uncharacterized membrane protein